MIFLCQKFPPFIAVRHIEHVRLLREKKSTLLFVLFLFLGHIFLRMIVFCFFLMIPIATKTMSHVRAVKVQLSQFMCADWSSHLTALFIYKKYERRLDQTTNAFNCCPSVR